MPLVRRQPRTNFLLELFARGSARKGLMRGHDVKDCKERLARSPTPPMGARRTFVPGVPNKGGFVAQVIVRLHVVCAVVASLAQVGREPADRTGNREL